MAPHSTIALDLDCLVAAHEDRPDTKAQQSAWEWLSELSSVTMQASAYIVPSAKWSNTRYLATATTCTCPGHAYGRACWHKEAAATLDLARENEAIDRAAAHDAATPSLNWHIDTSAVTPVQRAAHRVSYRAAQSSGLADLFA